MFFALFIFTRLLFIAYMVFIIGHVFGNFSKNRTLHRITRVAAILAIVLFFATNAFVMRGFWRGHHCYNPHDQEWCSQYPNDSSAADYGHARRLLEP